MSTVTYEGMFLLDANKYAANPQGVSGEVLALLERVGAKVLGTVMNKMKAAGGTYYYYNYGYGYEAHPNGKPSATIAAPSQETPVAGDKG